MLAVRYHVARQTHSNEEADIVNIQIFGTKKSFDTKKAQRYFKELRIKVQFIDLREKEMSKG